MTVVDVFQIVFSLSLSGSVLAGLILLCKALFKNKFSAQWHYYVWFLLIFRLLIPYAPESSLSVFNIFKPAVQGVAALYITETKAKVSLPESNQGVVINSGLDSTGIPRQNEPASSSTNTAIPQKENSRYYGWLSMVWLIGVLIVILYLAIVNASFSLRLKKGKKSNEPKVFLAVEQCKLEVGVHSEIPVFCSDQIKTPSLFGLIRPKLLLPPNMPATLSAEEMRYVFLHELSHLKRMDLWVNWITLLLRAIYWFNPVIWFAFAKMQEDCEVACDARVLRHINPEEHQKYGETIINLIKSVSTPRWIPVTTGMVNNKFSLRRRLKMITMFNRNSRKWSAAAIVLFVLVGITGLTSSVSKGEDAIKVPSAEKISSMTITGSMQVTVTKEEQETIQNFIDALKKARPYRNDVGTTPEFTVTLTMDNGEKILVFGGGERFQAIQINGDQYNIQGEELTRYFDRVSMLNSSVTPIANIEDKELKIVGFRPVKEPRQSPKPDETKLPQQKNTEFKSMDFESIKQKTSFEVKKPNIEKLELVSLQYMEDLGTSPEPTQVVSMDYKFNNQKVMILQGTNRNYYGIENGEMLVPEFILKNSVPITINGNKGFIKSSTEGTEIHDLYFNINGIGYTVWAENVSKEDIIKIAESIN